MSGYRTIVADPPWDYGRDNARQPSITHGGKGTRIERKIPYAAMSVADLLALRDSVSRITHGDCRLFLWATNRHLPAAFGVIETWGFVYRQTLVWRKTGNPSPFGGSVAPNTAEFLLVSQRGSPPVSSRLPGSVIDAPAAVFGHSAKPEAFLDYIESVSPGPYLEMFARRNRLGWDTWGDEALNHVAPEVASDLDLGGASSEGNDGGSGATQNAGWAGKELRGLADVAGRNEELFPRKPEPPSASAAGAAP